MNSFGRIFRISIFGESHGESVGIVVDGCPAGMPLTIDDFLPDLERRKGGTQKGTTPRQEEDLPIFKSGLFNNKTTGAPITILFENKNIRSGDYEKQRDVPRPGHADFVAHKKFAGFEDDRSFNFCFNISSSLPSSLSILNFSALIELSNCEISILRVFFSCSILLVKATIVLSA